MFQAGHPVKVVVYEAVFIVVLAGKQKVHVDPADYCLLQKRNCRLELDLRPLDATDSA